VGRKEGGGGGGGGGVLKGFNIFWGQKLANTCSFVGGRIIVQQEKVSREERSWTNPLNALQEAIHYTSIKFSIYCFSLLYEFFVHYVLRVEKFINMVLTRDLWNFSSFGRGNVLPNFQNSVALFRGHRQNTRPHPSQ